MKNERGIAILMVLTAITILTSILISFSYDAKINRIKSINIQDKSQARLNAESGIELAMARLKLYKEAYNYIQNSKGAKDFVNAQVLNQIWQFPFMLPVPMLKSMGQIQKDMIQDFSDEIFLPGGMQLSIQNQSLKFNVNMLRFSLVRKHKEEKEEKSEEEKDKELKFEDQIIEALKNGIEALEKTDEDAYNFYRSMELEKLVAYLKLYLSDQDSYEDDRYKNEAVRAFEEAEITPKFGSMASFEEMYLIPEWDTFLIDIIKNEFTVHPNITIDLNEITSKMLKLLIPEISDEEIQAFFTYRDDPEDPQFFNELKTFKNYIVSSATIMDGNDFDDRFTAYKKMGIHFGPAPTLFLVNSIGIYGRSEYKVAAYITMPAKPKRDKIDTSKITDPDKKKEAESENKKIEAENKKNILFAPRINEIYVD